MNDLPPYVSVLLNAGQIAESQLPANSRTLLKPLFAGGVLTRKMVGRGETIVVREKGALATWVSQKFPASTGQWNQLEGAGRTQAIAQRRDSKAAGRGVAQGVLHLRASGQKTTTVSIDDTALPIGLLTEKHGLAATLIHENSRMEFDGQVALVENLELFLQLEAAFPKAQLALNSAGRISDRLIACLARSAFNPTTLWHLPDYDPVGLSDYLRLRAALGERVELLVPLDLEERFRLFGNRKLLTDKRRNRELFEQLGSVPWPCANSAEVFRLINETGSGLEQESLLLKRKQ